MVIVYHFVRYNTLYDVPFTTRLTINQIKIMKLLFAFLLSFAAVAASHAGYPTLNATLTSSSSGTVLLDPNQPENNYFLNEVWRRAPGGAWQELRTTYQSYSFTHQESEAGTYEYRTRWEDPTPEPGQSQYSGWSTTATVTVPFSSPPSGVPYISLASTDSDGYFSVSWSAVSGGTYYQLQRMSAGSTWSTVNGYNTTRTVSQTLSNGTYSYRARACNNAGCSTSYSPTKSITVSLPSGTIPSIPSSLTLQGDGTHAIVAQWAGVGNASYYELSQSSGGAIVYSGSSTSAYLGTSNTITAYRVRACNSNGCSGWKYASY